MRLAIIIPTLDEEPVLRDHLPRCAATADLLIVADGGSRDDSTKVAMELGARVVTSESGRGRQLNAGAAEAIEAGADWLLFLHADTILPDQCRALLEQAQSLGCRGGGFLVEFDDAGRLFRLGSGIVNLRTRWFRVPLGDQAQFVRSEIFMQMGGFRDWPILEDLDFIVRLRRLGAVSVISKPVVTATRRFRERGIARTVATNWLIWALFMVGVEPARLARLYPHIR